MTAAQRRSMCNACRLVCVAPCVETQPYFLFLLLPLRYDVKIKAENSQIFFSLIRDSSHTRDDARKNGFTVTPNPVYCSIGQRNVESSCGWFWGWKIQAVFFYCGGARGETCGGKLTPTQPREQMSRKNGTYPAENYKKKKRPCIGSANNTCTKK